MRFECVWCWFDINWIHWFSRQANRAIENCRSEICISASSRFLELAVLGAFCSTNSIVRRCIDDDDDTCHRNDNQTIFNARSVLTFGFLPFVERFEIRDGERSSARFLSQSHLCAAFSSEISCSSIHKNNFQFNCLVSSIPFVVRNIYFPPISGLGCVFIKRVSHSVAFNAITTSSARGKSTARGEIEFLTDSETPLLNEIKNCMNLNNIALGLSVGTRNMQRLREMESKTIKRHGSTSATSPPKSCVLNLWSMEWNLRLSDL